MPSGAKKRKAAKKKQLQQNPSINNIATILTADHTQDSSNSAKEQEASPKTQSSIDVDTANLPGYDYSCITYGEVCVEEPIDVNAANSPERDFTYGEVCVEVPIDEYVGQDNNSTAAVFYDQEDSVPILDKILSGKVKRAEQLERVKKSLVEEVQEADKWAAFLHELLSDLNNFQLH